MCNQTATGFITIPARPVERVSGDSLLTTAVEDLLPYAAHDYGRTSFWGLPQRPCPREALA